MVRSIFRKLLTELGMQTEDAKRNLMGEMFNFDKSSHHKSCVGKYRLKTSDQHTRY